MAIGIVYIVLASYLFVFGFSRWKRNLHDVDGKVRLLDLRSRELGIEKLQLEIAQLQRNELISAVPQRDFPLTPDSKPRCYSTRGASNEPPPRSPRLSLGSVHDRGVSLP